MKSVAFIFILWGIVVMGSCGGRRSAKEAELTGKEGFRNFLKVFNEDTIFQLRRIKFPLVYHLSGVEDATGVNEITDSICSYEWEYTDFRYDKSLAFRQTDAYRQEEVVRDDTSVIRQIGIDNGIRCDYIFAILNGEWYLVEIRDSSN